MRQAIAELDRLLRGEATRLPNLKRGTLEVDALGLALVILVLGMLYGACMGSFGIAQRGINALPQLIATTGKVPLLFLLTLIVTFPSLYVFNALVGSRLTLASTLRLIVAAMAIMLAVLASLGTIVAFFSVSTTDYSFMLLLNVLVFTISGFLGMKFLLHTLHRLTVTEEAKAFAEQVIKAPPPNPASAPMHSPPHGQGNPQANLPGNPQIPSQTHEQRTPPMPGAFDKVSEQAISANVTNIFRIWIIVFGLVGAQMGWVLRPFLGTPDKAFSLFRPRESNFFEAVIHSIHKLLT